MLKTLVLIFFIAPLLSIVFPDHSKISCSLVISLTDIKYLAWWAIDKNKICAYLTALAKMLSLLKKVTFVFMNLR